LTGHRGLVLSVAYASDGAVLATGERHGTIRLWQADTGQLQTTLPGHTGQLGFSVIALTFAPDGMTLASGGYDSTVRVWSVAAKKPGN
jgi:WD40 repeat protein